MRASGHSPLESLTLLASTSNGCSASRQRHVPLRSADLQGDRAAVDWWAVIEDRDGTIETLAGTSLLRFAPDGRIVEQRDAFGSHPGRVELPDWAC